jgi:hypothetical protein
MPWWPTFVITSALVLTINGYKDVHTEFILDGSPAFSERTPSELAIQAVARPFLLASFIAFLAGTVLLVIALVLYLRRRHRFASNHTIQPTAGPRTASLSDD